MEPEELDKELDRLWDKVRSEASLETSLAETAAPPGMEREVWAAQRDLASEAMRLLKDQYEQDQIRWQELLDLKEKNIRELSERLKTVETRLTHLQKEYNEEQSGLLERALKSATD